MSGLIKAGTHGKRLGLEPFFDPSTEMPLEPFMLEPDPREAEIARLEAIVAERDKAIAEHVAALAAARDEGEEAGREAAIAEFELERKEALARLERALGEARDSLDTQLKNTGNLAIAVARQALDRMFGASGDRATTVEALIGHQLARVERDAVVALEVSRLDFPDTAVLAEMATRLNLPMGSLAASFDLPEGAARMRLRLGSIDLGIDPQWNLVRALLDDYLRDAEPDK